MTKKTKPDCYKCIHRKSIPGDAHSECYHPSLEKLHTPELEVMGIFASVGRAPQVPITTKKLNTVCNPIGVRNGWFNFPWNFDPVWLESCDGFEAK
jgi:hypothetical protein